MASRELAAIREREQRATTAHRNSERKAAWRLRCLQALDHWPDGNLTAWQEVCDWYSQQDKATR